MTMKEFILIRRLRVL